MPRKSSKDSIIKIEAVNAAIARRIKFDKDSVSNFPVVLSCDPAWQGGDDTVIWMKQGHYYCMLEKYKLRKDEGQTHQLTYNKLCHWERLLKADAVHIDQGEGTGIYTLAMNAEKYHWVLISFANSPTDKADPKDSEYGNIRAMMYYHLAAALLKGAVIDAIEQSWLDDIRKQFCWTKGTRHKTTYKKMAESKIDIKERVGQSPDIADGAVLLHAYEVTEKLPQNELSYDPLDMAGSNPIKIKPYEVDYDRELRN